MNLKQCIKYHHNPTTQDDVGSSHSSFMAQDIESSLHTEKQNSLVNFRKDALLCNKELELWDEGNGVPAVL